MSHIFISYSKKDIQFAEKLRQLLQDRGFAVWMDDTKLVPSERWWSTIEQNIKTCAAFIVIMSPNSQESDWVEREILIAEETEYRKPIFPVLLAGKRWSRLANIQYYNMTMGDKIRALDSNFVDALQRVAPTFSGVSAPPPLPTSKKEDAHGSRDTFIAVVGAIAVIIAAAIGIIPPMLERIDNANSTTIAQLATQTIEDLTPTLYPVQQIQTLDAQATRDAKTILIAGQTQTAQAKIDINASATAQTILDDEASAIARIEVYKIATALASITPTLTATSMPIITPTPTLTPSRTPTMTPTQIPFGAILFKEDFEDENLIEWFYDSRFAKIQTQNDNHVLNLTGARTDFLEFSLRDGFNWTNYSLRFRSKISQSTSGTSDLYADIRHSGGGTYMATLSTNISLSFERYIGSTWNSLGSADFQFRENTWYDIRIDVVGDDLKYYVNGILRLSRRDSSLKTGTILFGYAPNTNIYIDDITVIYLGDS